MIRLHNTRLYGEVLEGVPRICVEASDPQRDGALDLTEQVVFAFEGGRALLRFAGTVEVGKGSVFDVRPLPGAGPQPVTNGGALPPDESVAARAVGGGYAGAPHPVAPERRCAGDPGDTVPPARESEEGQAMAGDEAMARWAGALTEEGFGAAVLRLKAWDDGDHARGLCDEGHKEALAALLARQRQDPAQRQALDARLHRLVRETYFSDAAVAGGATLADVAGFLRWFRRAFRYRFREVELR